MNDAPADRSLPRQELERTKRPRTVISGPYGHPVHAMIVPVPIGAWVCAVVLDIAALAGAYPDAFAVAAQWLVAIGVIGAVVAAVFGLLDFLQLVPGSKAHRYGLLHLGLNAAAIVLFVVSFIVRAVDPGRPSVAGFILAIVGILCIGGSGFLGGELAYRYGVRVADERTQLEGHVSTRPAKAPQRR